MIAVELQAFVTPFYEPVKDRITLTTFWRLGIVGQAMSGNLFLKHAACESAAGTINY